MGLPCVLKELKTGNGTLGVVEGLASSAQACREYSPALPIPEQQQGSHGREETDDKRSDLSNKSQMK